MMKNRAKKIYAFLLALVLLAGSVQPLNIVYATENDPAETVTEESAEERFNTESPADPSTEDVTYNGAPSQSADTAAETSESTEGDGAKAPADQANPSDNASESTKDNTTDSSADSTKDSKADNSEGNTKTNTTDATNDSSADPTEEPAVDPAEESLEDYEEEELLEAAEEGSAIVEIRDLEVEIFYGATLQDDPVNTDNTLKDKNGDLTGQNYIWTAKSSAAGHRFGYRVSFSVSGNYELDPDHCEIRVPKSILRNRLGEFADEFEMSIPSWEEISYEDENGVRHLPSDEDLEEEVANDVDFYYITETDDHGNEWIVIKNFRVVETGKDVYIEMNYFTDETTFGYKDMGISDDFYAIGKATSVNKDTGEPVVDEKESNHIPVVINTTTSITSTEKKYPTLSREWNSSWGEAPSDADNYWYLLWEIKSTISDDTTQPYDFTLDDSVIPMSPKNGEDVPEMELVGYRMAGTKGFKTEAEGGNVARNQTIRGYRYDSVLTRIAKDPYASLERWEVWNGVTATVDPIDQVDPDTDANSRNKFVYETPRFAYPRGSFAQWKRADGAWRTYSGSMYTGTSMYSPFPDLGMKGGQWSRYDLEQFIDGNLTEYDNFDYAVWMVGAPFDGNFVSDGRTDDPLAYFADNANVIRDENDNIVSITGYGARPVVYELIDMGRDDLHLTLYPEGQKPDDTGIVLTSNDFAIDTLAYALQIEDARYTDATKGFSAITGTPTADDVLTFYAKFGTSDEWVKIATRNYYDTTEGTNGITILDTDHVALMTNNMITFKDDADCVAYKVVTQNAHYHCAINTVPNLHLKNSDAVMEFLKNTDGTPKLESIGLKNDSVGHVYSTEHYEDVLNGNAEESDAIYTSYNAATGLNMESDSDYARITQRDAKLLKSVVASSNNTKKRYYTITWRVDEKETIIYGEPASTEYVEQNGGTFYDLLPDGCALDVSSVAVKTDAGFLPEGTFTVEQVANYKNTGRTLMIVRISEPGDYYQVYFDTRHPWESIKDFGHDVYNPVAYETGNDNIATGHADDGGTIKDRDLMKDLTPKTDDNNTFLYAEREYDITAIVAAATGLTKKVKDVSDNDFSYDTFTTPNGDYIYRLRYATTSSSRAKNMVFFDTLENYVTPDAYGTEKSEWRGKLSGVDITQLKQMGIDAKVYLNRTENLDLESYQPSGISPSDMDMDEILTAENGWYLMEDFGDITEAKAIAIDMRKDTNGDPFVLDNLQSVTAYLFMKGPATADFTYTNPEEPNPDNRVKKWEDHKYPETYNNIYIYNTVIDRDDGEQNFYIHQDYTIVRFLVEEDVRVRKLNADDTAQRIPGVTFRLYGTSDYGTEVDMKLTTNSRGEANFKKVELGTYILQEYEASDDWLLDTTEHTVRIYVDTVADKVILEIDGEDKTDLYFEVTNRPRIHGNVPIRKMSIQTDAKDAVAIPNTTFRLSGTSVYGNDIVMVATSDDNGNLTFENLELGIYKLREIQANPDYILNETEYTVTIGEDGTATITDGEEPVETERTRNIIRNENRYWDFDFRKTDDENSAPLAGAEFRLSGVSDLGTNIEKTATSTASGSVRFTDVEKGTYVLEETKAPTIEQSGKILSYVLDPVKRIVTVHGDGTVEIEGLVKAEDGTFEGEYVLANKRALTGKITITKVWDDFDESGRTPPTVHIVTAEDDVIFGVTVTKKWTNGAPANGRPNVTAHIGTKNESNELVPIETTVNTRWVKDDNDNWTYYFPVLLKEGVTYYVWEDEPVSGYQVINNEDNPATVTNRQATIENKYVPPVKYAVAILGIGVDTDKEGNTMGLTFGPATGADYMASYKSHTPTGQTANGHDHRCVHNDDWDTIIYWNNVDPKVYEQCVKEGCTHSVELNPSGELYSGTSYTSSGDGANALYLEINTEYRFWNQVYSNSTGWGGSAIRAVLNGADSTLHAENTNAANITTSNCLLTWFPEELQAAIGERATKYDSVYNRKTSAYLKTTYDKLWLLSTNEIWSTTQNTFSDYTHPNEGPQYERFASNSNKMGGSQDDQTFTRAYYAQGDNNSRYTFWWLRSTCSRSSRLVMSVYDRGYARDVNPNRGLDRSILPCFALSRNQQSTAAPANSASPTRTTDLLAAPRKNAADNTTETELISGQQDGDADDPLKGWTDNGDGTWTYTFDVFDETAKYYVWEEELNGYISDIPADPGYIIINDGEITGNATITNKAENTGSLKLTKIVEGDGNSDEYFDFTITLTGNNEAQETALAGNHIFGGVVFTDGVAHVKLQDHQSITIDGLPAGISYAITEGANANYSISPTGETGEIESDKTKECEFHNTYTPPESNEELYNITLAKVEEGDVEEAGTYSFFVHMTGLVPSQEYKLSNGDTFTSFSDGTADFTVEITAGEEVEIYGLPEGATYQVTEAAGDYTASYRVTNAGSGGSIAKSTDSNETANEILTTAEETVEAGEEITITFTNRIEKKQKLTLRKEADLDQFTDESSEFTFTLAFSELPSGTILESEFGRFVEDDGEAEKTFVLHPGDELVIEDIPVGVKWRVTEAGGNYTATYTVEGKDGKVVSETGTNANNVNTRNGNLQDLSTGTETVDADEDGVVTFRNVLRTSDLTVSKTVKGSMGDKTKKFTFTISNAEYEGRSISGTFTAVDQDGNEIEGGITFTDGTATFELSHNEKITIKGLPVGTSYTITESNEDYTAVSSYSIKGKYVNGAWQAEMGESGAVVTSTILPDGISKADYTNTLDVAVPTDQRTGGILPGILIALGAASGIGIFVWRKRKRKGALS